MAGYLARVVLHPHNYEGKNHTQRMTQLNSDLKRYGHEIENANRGDPTRGPSGPVQVTLRKMVADWTAEVFVQPIDMKFEAYDPNDFV